MGAILVAWMVVAALPPPPLDDGLACQRWAVEASEALLRAPQPSTTPIDPRASGGLSEIPHEVWAELGTFELPPSNDAAGASLRAVKEGAAPVSSVPALDAALPAAEQSLRKVLLAARGPASRLPDAWQVWSTLGGHSRAMDRAQLNVPNLVLAFGWRGLERGRTEDAALACVGLAGFLRALGGTGLIGQMLSASVIRGHSLLCVATAQRSPARTRQELAAAIALVEHEWPPFAHTLGQELVFSQFLGLDSFPPELRSRVPDRWRALGRRASSDGEEPWTRRLRERLFGGWALKERCLTSAKLVAIADSPPSVGDPVFLESAPPTTLASLAWEGTVSSNWLGFARRVRGLRTQLRLLDVALRLSTDGSFVAPTDARTGRPVELRGSGRDRVVVGVADPAFSAEELRLPVPEGTTSP